MKQILLVGWLVMMTAGFTLGSIVWAQGLVEDNVLISLRADQEMLKDVLKEIEKQTGYTIKVDQKVQKRKVSLNLNKVSLSEGIHRLFSGMNYSVVFDDKRKNITVLSLGMVHHDSKTVLESPGLVERKLQENGKGSMAVTDSVLELHRKALLQPSTSYRKPEKSPMSISTRVLKKHQEVIQKGGEVRVKTEAEKSPMAVSGHVLDLHRQGLAQGTLQSSGRSGTSPMSEVDASMSAHREVLKKKK